MEKICSLIRTVVIPSRAKYIARNQVKIKPDTWSLQNRIKITREIIYLNFSDISLNDLSLNWNPEYEYANKKTYITISKIASHRKCNLSGKFSLRHMMVKW